MSHRRRGIQLPSGFRLPFSITSCQNNFFIPYAKQKIIKWFEISCKMSKINLLFANDSDSDHNTDSKFELNTNKDYAKSYNKFRSKELLKKRKY